MKINRADSEALVRKAYFAILGRAPDIRGLDHYMRLIDFADWTLRDIYIDFLRSEEFIILLKQNPKAVAGHIRLFFQIDDLDLMYQIEESAIDQSSWSKVSEIIGDKITKYGGYGAA